MNGETVHFPLPNLRIPSIFIQLDFTYAVQSLKNGLVDTAGLPSYVAYSISPSLINFTVSPMNSMRAGDISTIHIEGTLSATGISPSPASQIGQRVASTFDLKVHSYEGSFKVEN